ncbi:MAG: glycosyltransferase family 4 protein [Lentisphaeria bacterium]|jgi:glycosyltransferase involved in cell wall biosynthesis|nr:glycosyltransferase family 4 protein [Lentisphaeria bacterium]
MPSPTILFCLDFYYPHVGGAEVLFQNLAEGLATHGWRVLVVTQRTRGTAAAETVNGVEVHRVWSGNSRYLFAAFCLPRMHRLAREADLIHTTTFAAAWPAWLTAKLRRRPLALTVHEVWVGQWNRVSDAGGFSNALHDLLERLLYRCDYQNYIAVSQATAKALRRISVPAERVTTIYNGLDYDFWNPARHHGDDVRTRLGLRERFVFFFSGRPGHSKGLPVLLQALAGIVADHPQAMLVAVLSHAPACQAGLRRARRLLDTLALRPHVLIVPSVRHAELPAWVAAADTVVVPSLSEGFGFAAAEACAMGRPVIATDNASLPEVVSGPHLLVPPGQPDALAAAMRRALQGDFDQAPPRRFTLADNLQQHLKLYDHILNSPP